MPPMSKQRAGNRDQNKLESTWKIDFRGDLETPREIQDREDTRRSRLAPLEMVCP